MRYKPGVMLWFFWIGCPSAVFAQADHLFRVYEDNDFINIAGKGTDKGYTNGTRLDYWFEKAHDSRFFIHRWFPTTGPGSVNTFSYSLMQVMIVPADLSKIPPDKNDWPYSGSLILSHGLLSMHPVKQYSFQTQLILGVIGPASLAQQTQTWVHNIINYTKPRGWGYQMPGDILVNLDLQAEKMLWQAGKGLELIGGSEVQVGTMLDGIDMHLQLRAGRMLPYFSSGIGRFASAKDGGRRRLQFYFLLKPAVQWYNFNALLQGGLFRGKNSYYAGLTSKGQSPTLRRIAATIDAGVVLVLGNFSFSLTQKELSPLIHSVSDQTIGNISATLSW